MTEVILIRDISESDERPLLHIAIMHVEEGWSEQDLFSNSPENSFRVSKPCWDYLAEQILQGSWHRDTSCKRSYIVVSNRFHRNRQYAENVVRYLVRNRKEKQDRFFMVSMNPFAIFKAWKQGFTMMKIRDKESRRMLYEAVD